MTTVAKRGSKQPDKNQTEHEFARIKEGLKANQAKLAEHLRQRVGIGDWKIAEFDCRLDEGNENIDIVFSAPDGKKEKFIIVDISIPHLGIGQKYGLPGKAKLFQKEREVSALRIKKAIILIRKGLASVSTQPGRIRCPIIEIQLESIVKPEPVERRPAENRDTRDTRDTRDNRAPRGNRNERQPRNDRPQTPTEEPQSQPSQSSQPQSQSQPRGQSQAHPRSQAQSQSQSQSQAPARTDVRAETAGSAPTGITGVSQDLLFALKEAIVHECLSTMHKRCNKYVRKGLWRWIEREIMDPNVHFFLIILSSIYQGKTGEILSRRFKNSEDFSNKPEDVIQAIFSRENNLADEIKKDSERHRRALTKFLVCFSQTPPFEYLKSVFLKDFRSYNDGLRARMNVYATLEQLLDRCGFEGEKETRYPLEILDELKIFQGIMTGNYTLLRTENASKKLKHLVPQVEWTNEDIYSLRNQLAKALNLPSQEFNLNAFLPQAFFQDAKILAESRKEAIRTPLHQSAQTPVSSSSVDQPEQYSDADEAREAPVTPETATAEPTGPDNRPVRRDRKAEFFERRKAEKQARQQQRELRDTPPARTEREPGPRPAPEMPSRNEVAARPISARNLIDNLVAQPAQSAQSAEPAELREPRPSLDCDEARHRYFENFGGHLEEDVDALRLAMAMVRHEQEKAEQTAIRISEKPVVDDFSADDEPDSYRPPLKNSGQRPTVNITQNPPRRVSRPLGPDGQPSGNNPDRKRRFSRNSQNRNRPRRPNNGGGTR
ncbi:MAG TPA: hypothetical protein PLM07_09275 [Candidatus Rifleibacterium sp.]|nr:hypothetical protein [Candidatus Rifleibacterium sp.]HPT46078.1 hypothetical protein [Candidatus Rifleibacterium sp.]